MNYAIIAAGESSRLKQEGFESVKPLVKVGGEYLIERLIRLFKDNGCQSLSVIINSESKELQDFLQKKDFGIKINLIVKSTPSSLHSFWNIIHNSEFEECCLTTVDTIFNERDFKAYISYFQNNKDIDALMATTKFIDDEKPLYIKVDGEKITAFNDDNLEKDCDRVSAGIYCFRKKALDIANKAVREGVSRMRNYQRMLINNKLKVKDFLFSKVIDIDHVDDIQKAENLLKNNKINILAVERFSKYSRNCKNKDRQIFDDVVDNLAQMGFNVDIKNENDLDFNNDFCKYVISMARNPKVVDNFLKWEDKGAKVVNSPSACHNCHRELQIKIFQDKNIGIPDSQIVSTTKRELETIQWLDIKDYWIKRADFQTIERMDVIRVHSLFEGYKVLKNYSLRGIDKAVVSSHIEGDEIKFYGVSTGDWFYYYYPKENKFHVPINQTDIRIDFDKRKFIDTCRKAARYTLLDIFGGDAIVDKSGKTYILDMNDFPSYSCCKDVAAKHIAECFINKCELD